MFRNPTPYKVSLQDLKADSTLADVRIRMIREAAAILHKEHLIRRVRSGGLLSATGLGRTAAQFYVTHETAAKFNEFLDEETGAIVNDGAILELVGSAAEFGRLKVLPSSSLYL